MGEDGGGRHRSDDEQGENWVWLDRQNGLHKEGIVRRAHGLSNTFTSRASKMDLKQMDIHLQKDPKLHTHSLFLCYSKCL